MNCSRLIIAVAVSFGLATGAAQAQDLTVKAPGGRSATVTDAQLRDLHRLTVAAGFGEHHSYAGAPLSDLLALVGAPSEVMLHGPALDQVVLITGSDKFYAVLSMAETSASFRGQPVIIADEEDGKPLDAKEGPYRLIIGGDLKAARAVRMVTTIELRPIAP
jgi:hypothetical protein